jgi:hypothetical protein
VRLRGSTSPREIPLGTRHGTVTLTTALPGHRGTATTTASRGIFALSQTAATTDLTLKFPRGPSAGASTVRRPQPPDVAIVKVKARSSRHYPVRVIGRYSTGASYGTAWTTTNRCSRKIARTNVHVIDGAVIVHDLVTKPHRRGRIPPSHSALPSRPALPADANSGHETQRRSERWSKGNTASAWPSADDTTRAEDRREGIRRNAGLQFDVPRAQERAYRKRVPSQNARASRRVMSRASVWGGVGRAGPFIRRRPVAGAFHASRRRSVRTYCCRSSNFCSIIV